MLIELVDKDVSTFDHIVGLVLEKPLRSGDPATSDRRLPSEVQHQAQPEGEAHGAKRIPVPDLVLISGL